MNSAQIEMLKECFPGYIAPISAKKMTKFITDFSLNSYQ